MKHMVQIEHNVQDLSKEIYTFGYRQTYGNDTGITLDRYVRMERPSKRHGFRAVGIWERIDMRQNTTPKPEIPLDVQIAAIREFRASVCWSPKETT